MKPLLIVEDNRELLEALCATLRLAGHATLGVSDAASALEALKADDVGLVVSDVQMQPMDGLALLKDIRRQRPGLPVVLMTAYADIGKAVEAMRDGATDYLVKPFDAASLVAVVSRCLPCVPAGAVDGVVHEDPAMRSALEMARRVAGTSATVLVTGESGSGKEVVARYLHRHSLRSDHPFVAINCAAIPDHLLEATLFGYEKGSFTGATQPQPGKFEQAQGGTLLLYEISELPLALQAKLLRVLQEREVERVGGRRSIALDIRLIATTNRDLATGVARGAFREDLYYRLNVFPLQVPALRERRRDILPLARHFLALAARESGRGNVTIDERAAARLQDHQWPGNVRELANAVQRALILAPAARIEEQHLDLLDPRRAAVPAPAAPPAAAPGGGANERPADIKSLERAHILETLAAVNGSRKLAVQRLGISERTLRYKLQQYRTAGVN